MHSTKKTSVFGQEQFNTLAQRRTGSNSNEPKVITGMGSDATNSKALKARAKRKSITQNFTLHLIDVAKKENNKPMEQQLWNVYHCQDKVLTVDSKLHVHYCKNRLCLVCSAIRKADFINRYKPLLETWKEPYFVTLTIKSVSAKRLPDVVNNLLSGFQKIIDKCRKRYSRGKGIKLMGIKTLECNFNSKRRTYNPHLHLIVPDQETADLLMSEWLKSSKRTWTDRKGQHSSKVFNNEKALIEVIKYGTKIFTEPDPNKKKTVSRKVYIKAMYNILKAMQGHRLFDRFGFNLPPQSKDEPIQKISFDYTEWEFNEFVHDWYDAKSGQLLTGYQLPKELSQLLENQIDIQIE